MKIDKKALDRLAGLPDDRLWRTIMSLGASGGFDLSGVRVDPAQLDKIRSALGAMTDEDVLRAVQILDSCKNNPDIRP